MRIKDMITHKMYFLDILSNSPHYFYSKGIGATKENFNFDLRVERVKTLRLIKKPLYDKYYWNI